MYPSGYSNLKKRCRSNLDDAEISTESRTPYGIPIYDLIDTINQKHADKPEIGTDATRSSGVVEDGRKSKKRKIQTQLLSEKYRPDQFFDLLGNDDPNRHVLRWLHYWKSCVFGLPPILNEYTDRLGRPLRKVLLLNGPPGAGKTTAAHVIAKQAGFDVLEINASDERGAAVVQDRIVSAIQSHQVVSKRPVAIVADEVEGASEHGFVRALTNILNEDAKALSANLSSNTAKSGKRSGKGKRQPSLLLRPIIAICNDVWSPNLHSLRQHSEIVHFHKQTPSRLLKRLEQICLRERLHYNTRQLSLVAEHCDYDLRACLNAIQFGNRHEAELGSAESVELTDWNSLVKRQFLQSSPATFQQLESCTDLDKLVAACFTAYLEGGNMDDTLKRQADIGEYLALADNRRANDELKAFTAHAFGYIFRSPQLAAQRLATPAGKSFGKPPSYYEETKRTKSILATVLKNSSGAIKKTFSMKVALMELLPFFIRISNPLARTSLNSEDKARLQGIASNFREIGLNLRTEKLENGAFVHRLEPPIELACIFGEDARAEASNGLYITRSQIKETMHEIERQVRQAAVPLDKARTTSVKEALTQAAVPAPARAAVDLSEFFVKTAVESNTQIQRKVEHRAKKVWVQYSEGFSNAVRKPIGWNELFGL